MSLSWELAKRSTLVIRAHKKLLVWPSLSLLLTLLLLALLIVPALHLFQQASTQHNNLAAIAIILLLLLFFFVVNFLVNFFNFALIDSIFSCYASKRVDLAASFRRAIKNLLRIALWNLINTTIGIVIRLLEGWSDKFSQFPWVQKYLHGLPFSIASYFVLPILVAQHLPPYQALAKSSQLICNTWGNNPKPQMSLGWIFLPMRLVCILPLVWGYWVGHVLIGAIITIVLWQLVSLISAVMYFSLACALYLYCAFEVIPTEFTSELLARVFTEPKH